MKEFLPLLNTLLTLLIGGYLFSRLTERRAKKDKIREQAIQLLEEVGNDLNSILSLIYGRIRTGNFDIAKDSPIEDKRSGLFTKRFSIRIRSKAYLGSEEFWQKYERLTFEIDRIVRFIASLSKGYEPAKVRTEIQGRKKRLEEDWPFEGKPFVSKYDSPSNELEEWTHMVWDRAIWLVSTNLQAILKLSSVRQLIARWRGKPNNSFNTTALSLPLIILSRVK